MRSTGTKGANERSPSRLDILSEFKKKFPESFDPKKYLVPGATLRDIEVWKEVFDLFDLDGSGSLTPMNIRNAMLTLGYNPKRNIIYQMVSDLDQDESGGIEFREFVNMMVSKPGDKDTDEDFLDVFKSYDVDNKGYIVKEDLIKIAKELQEDLTPEEAELICAELDESDEGKITLKAWNQFMKQKYLT